jgi:aminoglycoside/choline kinase family phosphotransferase
MKRPGVLSCAVPYHHGGADDESSRQVPEMAAGDGSAMTTDGSFSADRGSMHDALIRLFMKRFGHAPRSVLEIAGDGSNRSYFRLVGNELETAVGAYGPDREENRAFFAFTRAFLKGGLPVPRLYGIDDAARVWLEEDLGDTTLFNALVEARRNDDGDFPAAILPRYRRVLEWLPRFQVEGARLIDFDMAYPRAAFDRQSIVWDLNYFKYHFLKLAQVPFNESRLERDFDRLADFLLQADTSLFLYRDFQSRNIMLDDAGEPHFIDYQGGRRGAPQYDIASLLYDAKAAIPDPVRDQLLDHYLGALGQYVPVDRDRFIELYRGYVLVRIMQAMGAYGYRGFFERKARFLQSVPYAARNLRLILERGLPIDVPELRSAFERIADDWGEAGAPATTQGLSLIVNSFSFRRGYPDDQGGHGGGYVFDCRALPNPGRHLEYCDQCGRDTAVVDYLERMPETHEFWRHVQPLIDRQVEEYLRRGFSSLTVSFGCTGGQHRSVYFAERLAAHMRHAYPQIEVCLRHREERNWPLRPNAQPGTAGDLATGAGASGAGGSGATGAGSSGARDLPPAQVPSSRNRAPSASAAVHES